MISCLQHSEFIRLTVTQQEKQPSTQKGNEAEEFLTKIIIKVIVGTAVMVIGVGVAVYYTSGVV